MRVVSVSEPIYRSKVFVFIGAGEEFSRWLERVHRVQLTTKEHGAAQSLSWFDDNGDWYAAIRLPYWRPGNPWEAGVLAHEAMHVAQKLAKPRGLKGEAKNYYLQWLVEEATRKLNGRKLR